MKKVIKNWGHGQLLGARTFPLHPRVRELYSNPIFISHAVRGGNISTEGNVFE